MQDLPGWPARLVPAHVCSPASLVPLCASCRRNGPKVGQQRPGGQMLTSARQAPAHKFSPLPPWCTALRCNSSDRMSTGLMDWATNCTGYETVASSPVPLPVFALPLSPPHFLLCPHSCFPEVALAGKVLVHKLLLQALFSRKSWPRHKHVCLILISNC